MRVSLLGGLSSSAFLFRFTEALVDDTVVKQSSQPGIPNSIILLSCRCWGRRRALGVSPTGI